MKNKFLKIILPLTAVLFCFHGNAQIIEKTWEQFYSSQDSILNISTDVTANGDLFVSGYVHTNTNGRDIVTLKYDANGNLLWDQQFDLTSNDVSRTNICDNQGNVYTIGSTGSGSTSKSVILKYSSNGLLQWYKLITVGTSNAPFDLIVNSANNPVVLTQNFIGSDYDVVVSELDAISGSVINQFIYDSGVLDSPVNLDKNSNNKIAFGTTSNGSGYIESTVIELDNSLSSVWNYTIANSGWDEVKSVKYNSNDELAVLYSSGSALNEANVVKLSGQGVELWHTAINDDNIIKRENSLYIDDNNNIITAYSHNNSKEISVNLIDNSGSIQWREYYYGDANAFFYNFGVVSDGNRIIFSGTNLDITKKSFLVVALNYSGAQIWEFEEGGLGSRRLTDFDVNTNQDVVVAGEKETVNGLFEITLINLSERDIFDAPDLSGNEPGFLAFFENLGRINNTNGSKVESLHFLGQQNDNGHYFFDKFISFTHLESDQDTSTFDTLRRWDFNFQGSFNPTRPVGTKPIDYHTNYYYEDIKRERVNGYDKIVYPSAYSNIDIEVSENTFGPVISFVIYPGGDFSDISFNVNGATSTIGNDGSLNNTVGNYTQSFGEPIVFTELPSGQINQLPNNSQFSYSQNGQSISFNLPPGFKNNPRPLVIQMSIKGSTQTKGAEDNLKWSSYIRKADQPSFGAILSKVVSDDNNNTYYTGNVYDNNSINGVFPTTVGVPFPMPIGETDITVMKINPDIEIQWATYYGSNVGDAAYSIATTEVTGKVMVVGSSSSTNFPLAPGVAGSYQENSLGESCLIELNPDGTALWATKFELAGLQVGGAYKPGLLDVELINGLWYVVGSRAGISPATLPNSGLTFHSTLGTGFIGAFKSGGEYVHGSGFGSTVSTSEETGIYAIDKDGSNNYALTGYTKSPDFIVQNAPAGYGAYLSADPDYSNAFVTKINNTGAVDFSYFISSVDSPTPQNTTLATTDALYGFYKWLEGDRGNDIKFSPDGSQIYLVGESYGEKLTTQNNTGNANAYLQTTRFPAYNGFTALRTTGFIFQVNASNGSINRSTYFGPNEQVENFGMTNRLQEIAFDDQGNYFISGQHYASPVNDNPIPGEYNIPISTTQPQGFYQQNAPTYSDLNCKASGFDNESFIIAFNGDDEHIWSTYIGGHRQDQIKSITTTADKRLYFSGVGNTINQNIDANAPTDCPNATAGELDMLKFPYWDYNDASNLDWYNPDGANQSSEVAGFFDITDINVSGPVLETFKGEFKDFLIYPNPNNTGILFLSSGVNVQKVEIYTVDGKIVKSLDSKNITQVDVGSFVNGTYILKCHSDTEIFIRKFIVK